MESGGTVIVALAKAAFEASMTVKKPSIHVARIIERLHWIMCQSDKWKYICDPTYEGDTYRRLKKVLKRINYVLQAESQEPKTWKHKIIKLIGAKKVNDAVADADHRLCVVLEDFQIDESTFKFAETFHEMKEMKEIMETFNMTTSTTNSNLTNQEELDAALESIMDATHELALEDHHLKKKAFHKLEIDMPSLVYSENDILGGGTFADVFSGTYHKKKVAIKRLKIDERGRSMISAKQIRKDARKIAMEALLADRCGIHPNIVQIFGYHVSMADAEHRMEEHLVVMELMSITLFAELHYHNIQPSTFQQRFGWMLGIARALEFLHLQGIVHHDVNSLNILLDASRTEAKLSDFGEAKVKGLNTMMSTSFVESHKPVPDTIGYQAPELFSQKVQGASRVSEMYAFGVTVWECLTGKVPHKGKKVGDIGLLATTEKDKRMLKIPTHMSASGDIEYSDQEIDAWKRLQHVASSCTVRDGAKRLTATQVVREWNRRTLEPPPLEKQDEAPGIPKIEGAFGCDADLEAAMEPTGTQIEGAFGCDADLEAAMEPTGNHSVKGFAKSRKRMIAAGIAFFLVILIIIVASTAGSGSGTNENLAVSSPDQGTQTPTQDSGTDTGTRCIESSQELTDAVKGWTGEIMATREHYQSTYGPIEDWCFGSGVTHMSYLFAGKSDFNDDISGWDVSSVTHMDSMFNEATSFNQNIGQWDVSSVETMERMFYNAESFNKDIGGWTTSSVTNMRMMFYGATKFNANIELWSVSSVTVMSGMFAGASNFNQDIGGWDVSSVGKSATGGFGSFDRMFLDAISFNQDIGQWDVSSASSLDSMFQGALRFNKDISMWDVSSARSFDNMLYGAEDFKQNLCPWGGIIPTAGGVPSASNMFKDTRCFFAHQDPDFTSYSPGPFCYSCNQF